MFNFALMSVSLIIVILTCVVSYKGFSNKNLINKFLFHPVTIHERKEWWRFFSHGLIHADLMHLAFNMLALYSFGGYVEHKLGVLFPYKGELYFFILYVSALLVSSVITFEKNKRNPAYSALGASGAVSAIVYAGILMDPLGEILVFFIPMPGWAFAVVYLFYSNYMAKKQLDNIGHDAHFYGAVYGVVFMLLFKPELGMNFIELLKQKYL